MKRVVFIIMVVLLMGFWPGVLVKAADPVK